jgi:hypothetical protein
MVDQEMGPDLLEDTVRGLTAEHDLRTTLVGFDLGEDGFDLSGRCGALLRRTPLRTGRAALTASGSSRP